MGLKITDNIKCKKSYIYGGVKIFENGQTYIVTDIQELAFYDDYSIFLNDDYKHSFNLYNINKRGLYLYDYFYNNHELRNKKLETILQKP